MFEDLIKNNQVVEEDGDYRDDDLLLVCGKCHTRKETTFELGGKTVFVRCMCQCEKEEQDKIEQRRYEEQEKIRFKNRQLLIDTPYRNIYLSDSDTKLEVIEKYIDNFQKMKQENLGLMIYGGVGNGKTFMASCIANELCKRGYKVLMEHITKALNKISRYENDDYLKELEEVDLLIIDDVGVNRNSEFQNEQFNRLIDVRYASRKPLIITTNLNRKNLVEEKDLSLSRTYNRLLEITQPLPINTQGRRIDIAKSKNTKFKEILGIDTTNNLDK